jgi:hypothetical protein
MVFSILVVLSIIFGTAWFILEWTFAGIVSIILLSILILGIISRLGVFGQFMKDIARIFILDLFDRGDPNDKKKDYFE